jgi:mono/diheme cytochrome c family protein
MKAAREVSASGFAILAGLASLGVAFWAAMPIRSLEGKRMAVMAEMPTPSVEDGRRAYSMSCVDCHGDDARGGEGPDLRQLTLSDARIATTIKNGVKGEMPSFKRQYDEKQVASLVAYLRTLH